MTELKMVLGYLAFNLIVFALGLALPKIVTSVKPLKQLVTPGATDVLQGTILAYALIFGVLIPITTYVATFGV